MEERRIREVLRGTRPSHHAASGLVAIYQRYTLEYLGAFFLHLINAFNKN